MKLQKLTCQNRGKGRLDFGLKTGKESYRVFRSIAIQPHGKPLQKLPDPNGFHRNVSAGTFRCGRPIEATTRSLHGVVAMGCMDHQQVAETHSGEDLNAYPPTVSNATKKKGEVLLAPAFP